MSNGNGVYDFDWTSSVPAVPVGEFTSLGLIRTTEEIQIIHNSNVVASTPYDSDNQIPTTDEETFELLLGGDADDEEALTTLSNLVSEIDEFTFHTIPTPTHHITNPTSDLIVHLKFDEGRGLNLHNSAVNSDINNHRLSIPSTEFMVKTGKPETWVYSTLPQPSINTLEDTPIIITLNGTSSTSDPLTAILTSLPIYGSLHYPTNTNLDGQVVTYDPTPILTINSTVNVGRSLVYVPVGNMKGEDTFEYAVKTTSTSNFSPDEFSPTVNQVKIDVTSINDPTYFTFNPTNKLSLSFLNYYTVMDVDTLEEDWDSAALETEIKVETGEGVKSVMTVRGDENSLVWGQGMVKGGEKVENTKFTSSLSNLNTALDGLQLSTDTRSQPSKTSLTITTKDQGLMGDAGIGAKSTTNLVDFSYRLGSLITIKKIFPTQSAISGEGDLTLTVSNVNPSSSLTCVFNNTLMTSATFQTTSTLTCPIPSFQSLGFTSVHLIDSNSFESNRVQYQIIPTPTVDTITPTEGSILGSTTLTLTGSGFSSSTVCVFSSTGINRIPVLPLSVSSTVVTCLTPPQPSSLLTSDISISTTTNGIQYSNLKTFTYTTPVEVSSISPTSGFTSGGLRTITLTGSGFPTEDSEDIMCKFGITLTQATLVSSSQITCHVPPHSLPNTKEVMVQVTSNKGADWSKPCVTLYTYIDAPIITSLKPNIGTLLGGTSVTIEGSNFNSNLLHAKVGDAKVSVAVESSNRVSFITPPNADAGETEKQHVSLGDIFDNYVSTNLNYTYTDPVVINHVDKLYVSSSKPTQLKVFGEGFYRSSYIKCLFGDGVERDGVYVNPNVVSCLSLGGDSTSSSSVSVSFNSRDYSNSLPFTYVKDDYSQLQLSPTLGTTAGNTNVVFTSTEPFPDINDDKVFALFDSTLVQCSSSTSTRISCESPSHLAGSVPVSISFTSGATYSAPLQYEFKDDIIVTDFSPNKGSNGDTVTILGSNFDYDDKCYTITSSKPLASTFVNSGRLDCAIQGEETGANAIRVSKNGYDFIAVGSFEVYQQAQVTATLPTRGKLSGASVTLTGNNFLNSADLSCAVFANSCGSQTPLQASTSLTFLTNTQTICKINSITPDLTLNTNVFFKVSYNNGHSYSDECNSIPFVVSTPPLLDSVAPSKGPTTGKTPVTLSGSLFPSPLPSTAPIVCKFGTTLSTTYASPAGAVVCASPPSDSTSTLPLSTPATVTTLSPKFGSQAGGTKITVHGNHFLEEDVLCVFQNSEGFKINVAAEWVQSTIVTCPSPVASDLQASNNDQIYIGVSNNNGVDVSNLKSYTYKSHVIINGVLPENGPVEGKTTVKLTADGGVRFGRNDNILCRFGASEESSEEVEAAWISEKTVECDSPEVDESKISPIYLSSNNGLDWSSTGYDFTYYSNPIVKSVSPSAGPMSGGTPVTIIGENVADVDTISCVFGDIVVVPTTISHDIETNLSTLVCLSPSTTSPSNMALSISLNGGSNFVSGSYTFTSHESVSPSSIYPMSGPVDGNSMVSVYGANFIDTEDLSCRFGDEVVPATFVSASLLTCVSPPLPSTATTTTALLQISTNGVDYSTTTSTPFTYSQPVSIDSISPLTGPETGSTRVTLTGANFNENDPLVCEFGSESHRVAATVISSTVAICTTPSHMPGPVTVSVSSNGQQWSPGDIEDEFTYTIGINILSASPAFGPLKGETSVTLTGSNFLDTENLVCMFGDEPSPSVSFISSTQIVCEAPRQLESGTVALTVTNNGITFEDSGVTFTYSGTPAVLSVTPISTPISGRTVLIISGSGFAGAESQDTICKFTSTSTPTPTLP
ncbi:hypothetical protein TL16_g06703 [Triparma laevis f. inornata]|uniref:IPT/TIG domain-containing protein n=1 Tax=Triparma laevis f. inornata TaxID=1714386 RepID=A0A9W7EG16_9STRA|nr:hypothetical protein TL16_g06703 [Triparma laevis f. inornata]